ncbi:MAG TPA: restriction endonuclease, partial [Thermoanaerobaculia bacterium]
MRPTIESRFRTHMMDKGTSSATDSPDFQLHSLGWKSFQDLCLVILSDQLGQAVKRFSTSRDGGRDGAFLGEWKPTGALSFSGETVVQCKFSHRPSVAITMSSFEDEIAKAAALMRRRRRDNYVLITNCRMSAEFEEAAAQTFDSLGYKQFHAFGYEWIAAAIQASPRLRVLVPRLYGLGDLSQILDERCYAQTQKLLEAERDNLKKFVITRPYRQAVESLSEHG